MRVVEATERFWSKVDKSGSCWLWTAYRDKDGYGRCRFLGKGDRQRMAHRISFELAGGVLVDGMTIDHTCNTPACVNPDHLKQMTIGENVLRNRGISAANARKTHCKRGHPLAGENLYVGSVGLRVCRTCKRDEKRRAYLENPGLCRERSRQYRKRKSEARSCV